MLLFRAGWFYFRLILADLQFFCWFFWRQYLKTQVMGVSAGWILLAGLLAFKQLSAWNVPTTTVDSGFTGLAKNQEIHWYLTTPVQTKFLCHQLEKAAELQPTHRDILIDLSFCKTAENKPTESIQLWDSATRLDPNLAIFSPKQPFQPKLD